MMWNYWFQAHMHFTIHLQDFEYRNYHVWVHGLKRPIWGLIIYLYPHTGQCSESIVQSLNGNLNMILFNFWLSPAVQAALQWQKWGVINQTFKNSIYTVCISKFSKQNFFISGLNWSKDPILQCYTFNFSFSFSHPKLASGVVWADC
jgi:hypothetical protein